jgi:asparagine synthetase B (glutamine-hydrolysing)
MCGIFGCILKEGNAAPVIHAALKRLEYRGYDSVGEATLHEGKITIFTRVVSAEAAGIPCNKSGSPLEYLEVSVTDSGIGRLPFRMW